MRLKVQEESSSVGKSAQILAGCASVLPWCLVAEKYCPQPVPSLPPTSLLPSPAYLRMPFPSFSWEIYFCPSFHPKQRK